MLVLSRKVGEKVYIGDDVVITVVEIDRGKIRLGIQCPWDVRVYREELLTDGRRAEIEVAATAPARSGGWPGAEGLTE